MEITIKEYKGFKAECWFDGMHRYCIDSECGDIHVEVSKEDKDAIQSKFEEAVDERLKWLGHNVKQPKHRTKLFSRDFKNSVIAETPTPILIGDVVWIPEEGNRPFFLKVMDVYNNNEELAFTAMHYNHKNSLINKLLIKLGW